MKKECTCRKIVKDDKVTVLYKCKACKKHDLKVFDKAIELAKAIVDIHTSKNVPVPEYKSGGIVNDTNYKEFVVCDGKNTPLTDYLKAKGFSDLADGYFKCSDGTDINKSKITVVEYFNWLEKISDKNTQRDFNKGMLEADKELRKVFENNNNKSINIKTMEKLGKLAKDKLTGFSGVITSKHVYLHGNTSYGIEKVADPTNGELKDPKKEFFEEGRIEILN